VTEASLEWENWIKLSVRRKASTKIRGRGKTAYLIEVDLAIVRGRNRLLALSLSRATQVKAWAESKLKTRQAGETGEIETVRFFLGCSHMSWGVKAGEKNDGRETSHAFWKGKRGDRPNRKSYCEKL